MNHDLTLDRRAFALWASGDLGAHIDIDGSLGAQRGVIAAHLQGAIT